MSMGKLTSQLHGDLCSRLHVSSGEMEPFTETTHKLVDVS